MGTNYYQIIDCCDKCGRGSDKRHIGKSSSGWPFALRIYPDEGINSWADWKERLKVADIQNEYGQPITVKELEELIVLLRRNSKLPHVVQTHGGGPTDPDTQGPLCHYEFC